MIVIVLVGMWPHYNGNEKKQSLTNIVAYSRKNRKNYGCEMKIRRN